MDQEIKAQWVAALREPGRKQAHGKLHTDYGQCCLGVLCELAGKAGVIGEPEYAKPYPGDPGYFMYPAGGNSTESHYLPFTVREWAGLDEHDPLVHNGLVHEGDVEDDVSYSLSEYNDGINTHKHSFNEIADLIEEYL